MNGVLVIDKPQDFTSFDVVAVMRRLCRQKKIGHTGTLDPMATGVLPLLLGSATKAASLLEDGDKTYKASFALGWETDTQDSTGKTLRKSGVRTGREQVERAAASFRGDIMQLPPMYSAVQVDGKRLYTLARQGIMVEREKRPVTIYRLELLSFCEEEQSGELLVECSKGTYIRTLCADIGEALGTYGVMTALRRTRACGFSLEEALPLEQAREMEPEELKARMLPADLLFSSKPAVTVSAAQAARFLNGGGLSLERTGIKKDGWIPGSGYRVYSPDRVCLGLGAVNLEKMELSVLKLFPQGNEGAGV